MQTMKTSVSTCRVHSDAAGAILFALAAALVAGCALMLHPAPVRAQVQSPGRPGHDLGELFADSPLEPATDPLFGDAILPRIAWKYDFDDPDSPGDFPLRFWVRMTGSERRPDQPFPMWNETSYDPPRPEPGEKTRRVFQLETRGGNTGVRLVDGVIPAIPLTDYLIRVDARTLDLDRARGVVSARFLDDEGKPIAGSDVSTAPIDTDGIWQPQAIALRGRYPNVAWIQIDLLLLQPAYWAARQPVGQEVQLEDVTGRVQFDNLSVWRLPRVELSVSSSNVEVEPNSVVVNYQLQDLARKELKGQLRVFDIDGNLIDETILKISQPSVKGAWTPNVRKFGWYRALFDVFENQMPVARAGVDFAYVPMARRDLSHELNPQEFTIIFEHPPADRTVDAMDGLLNSLGVGRVVLPAWTRRLDLSNIRDYRDRLTRAIEHASGTNLAIDLAFTELPDELAQALNYRPDRVVDAIAFDDDRTSNYLEDFLVRFGQRVQRWVIGGPHSESLVRREDLDDLIERIDRSVSMLVPQPTIELPFPGDFRLPTVSDPSDSGASADEMATGQSNLTWSAAFQEVHHRFIRTIPSSIRYDGISDFMAGHAGRNENVGIFVEPVPAEVYGERQAALDLAKRTILARESGATEIAIDQPWREIGSLRPKPMPTPAFPVWRTLREQLAGRKAYGRISLEPGLVAIIFADELGESGVIACWNDSPESDEVSAAIHLGPGPAEAVDVFGNRTPVPMLDERHAITVGRDPVFITGIDAQLAMFRAGVRLENDFVEAAAVQAPNNLIIRNPWNEPVHGVVRITSPVTWRFQPRYQPLSIEPGGEAKLPITLTIPIYETAGAKRVDVQIAIETPRRYEIETSFLVDLGHKNIIVRPTYSILPNTTGEDDLVVTLEITNRGSSEMSIRAFCIAPPDSGLAYQHADVPGLAPGDVVERAFIYRHAARAMAGKTLRVGFRGIDNSDRLNLLLKVGDDD